MTKFETSYERALAAAEKFKKIQAEQAHPLPRNQRVSARFARPSLPRKYPRIHFELPEMKEVYDLVDRHGLYLVAESLSQVGFRIAKAAKRSGDREYGDDIFGISKKLMTTIGRHHEAANLIIGISQTPPSDKRMNDLAEAVGFHNVVEALAVTVNMAAENILLKRRTMTRGGAYPEPGVQGIGPTRDYDPSAGGGRAPSLLSALQKDLESVARQAKVLFYER